MADITSKRISSHVVETRIEGSITSADTKVMAEQFALLGKTPVWLIIDAAKASYAPTAIDSMSKEIERLQKDHGLEIIVASLQSKFIRMGAAFVSRLVTIPIKISATRQEGMAEVKKYLTRPNRSP